MVSHLSTRAAMAITYGAAGNWKIGRLVREIWWMARAERALARSWAANLYLPKGQQRQSVQSSGKRGAFFIKGLTIYQKFPPDRATLGMWHSRMEQNKKPAHSVKWISLFCRSKIWIMLSYRFWRSSIKAIQHLLTLYIKPGFINHYNCACNSWLFGNSVL